MQTVWARSRQIERKQWSLWVSAIIVTLLLTAGILSFTFPYLFQRFDPIHVLNLREAIQALMALVILFDVYAFYQQLQIYRARRQLLESENLFHLIGENSEDMIAVVDTAGRRHYNSPSYTKTLGYSQEELKATPGLEQVHPDDRPRVIEAAEEARRTGKGRKVEYRFRHKDGSWRILESTASAVRSMTGEIERLVIVNRDITDRKNMEDSLRQTEEQLRDAQRLEALGRLSHGFAHDVNNLLSVIIGHTEVLETRMERSDASFKSVEEIRKAGQSAASLTRQLLAFSQQRVLQPTVVDLNAVITDLDRMLRQLVGKNIQRKTSLDPTLGKVKADLGHLRQVIMNLAIHSSYAMPESGMLDIESTNCEIGLGQNESVPFEVRPGRYVQLTLSDTGPDIDIETETHVVEPFFTRKGKGDGAGLATAYGIVRQSGGHIWATNKPGGGVVFTILFPVVTAPFTEATPAAPLAKSRQTSETILLVENDASDRKLMADALEGEGFEVLAVADSAQAIVIAQAFPHTIHLLVTEVEMSGTNSSTLAKRLWVSRPDLRVLHVTDATGIHRTRTATLPDDAPIVQKPFTREALLKAVRKAFALAEVQDDMY
jgi:two-component system cell cycle sensor histidine kinase/response regulator CckA